jgi:hypothetical protein
MIMALGSCEKWPKFYPSMQVVGKALLTQPEGSCHTFYVAIIEPTIFLPFALWPLLSLGKFEDDEILVSECN